MGDERERAEGRKGCGEVGDDVGDELLREGSQHRGWLRTAIQSAEYKYLGRAWPAQHREQINYGFDMAPESRLSPPGPSTPICYWSDDDLSYSHVSIIFPSPIGLQGPHVQRAPGSQTAAMSCQQHRSTQRLLQVPVPAHSIDHASSVREPQNARVPSSQLPSVSSHSPPVPVPVPAHATLRILRLPLFHLPASHLPVPKASK